MAALFFGWCLLLKFFKKHDEGNVLRLLRSLGVCELFPQPLTFQFNSIKFYL